MSNEQKITTPGTTEEKLSDEAKEALQRYIDFCMPLILMFLHWVVLPDMLNRFANWEKEKAENGHQAWGLEKDDAADKTE